MKFRRILPMFLLLAFVAMVTPSCVGHKHCGDCPNFKTNGHPQKMKHKKH